MLHGLVVLSVGYGGLPIHSIPFSRNYGLQNPTTSFELSTLLFLLRSQAVSVLGNKEFTEATSTSIPLREISLEKMSISFAEWRDPNSSEMSRLMLALIAQPSLPKRERDAIAREAVAIFGAQYGKRVEESLRMQTGRLRIDFSSFSQDFFGCCRASAQRLIQQTFGFYPELRIPWVVATIKSPSQEDSYEEVALSTDDVQFELARSILRRLFILDKSTIKKMENSATESRDAVGANESVAHRAVTKRRVQNRIASFLGAVSSTLRNGFLPRIQNRHSSQRPSSSQETDISIKQFSVNFDWEVRSFTGSLRNSTWALNVLSNGHFFEPFEVDAGNVRLKCLPQDDGALHVLIYGYWAIAVPCNHESQVALHHSFEPPKRANHAANTEAGFSLLKLVQFLASYEQH